MSARAIKIKTAGPPRAERMFRPPEWQWAQTGDVGWWVRADWQGPLLCPTGLRLDEWRREGRLSVVKKGPHRVVYRVDLPEGSIYVKHFLVPNLRAKVRQWFRRGKGRNEGRRTRYLDAIGVPTTTPIALGEQRRHRFLLENYLITPAIPDAVPLDAFVERRLPELPPARRSRVRQELARALAVLTARLHDAGFVHKDFHPGNVLVRVGPDDRPVLSMIDLDALRVCRRLRWPDAQQNLALLNHYFWLRSARTDRYRFLQNYLDARRDAPADPRAFARGIETSTRSWAERLWRRWGRRCCKSNKYFKKYRAAYAQGIASRDLPHPVVHALLADPDAPFRRPDTVILKDSRTATVAETTLTVSGRPVRVIYKRFNRKKWLDPLLTYFRPSRAWQAWQAGQHLLSRAVPTPRNLAFLARLRPFWRDPLFWYLPHETYLVTLKAEPAVTLSDYVHRVLPTLEPAARRERTRRLSLALARLLRTLHERSLSDRDLKTSNILIVGDPDDPDVKLQVIDLVGVRLIHPLPLHRRVQNLARLHLSLLDVVGRTRLDTLRFLRAYLPWGLSPHNDWKGLWRAIDASSLVKLERNRRRGRQAFLNERPEWTATPRASPMTPHARPARPREFPPRRALAALLAAAAVSGCATLGGDPGQPLVPDRVVTRAGPFAVHTNAPIAAGAPVVSSLLELERDLATNLGLRVADDGPPVDVYVLRDREAFTHFLTFYYPELPPRRAFFLAQGPRRFVYTYYNDRLDEDLRHEATHALLHAAVGDLPLWLDEGLAEYFEGPGGRMGLNPEHLAKLPNDLKTAWRPDLARLETLKTVREMSPRDYRESWAWVYYLLNGSAAGKGALLAYLADLREQPGAAPMSGRLTRTDRDAGRQMLAHLERARSAPVAPTAAGDPPTVLFQNSAVESAPRGGARRSLLGRFLAIVGLAGRSP